MSNQYISKNKLYLIIIAVASFVLLTVCSYILISTPKQSLQTQILLILLLQIASAFFFPITIGKIMQLIRDRDIATVLWNFISDCGDAGLTRFYASREGKAAEDLESGFDSHEKEDILMTGPSLRLFFVPGSHYYHVIQRNVPRYERYGINIRVVNANMEKNISLPIRSFIEEFNANGEHPKGDRKEDLPWQKKEFDWNSNAHSTNDSFIEKFYHDFYRKYGIKGSVYNQSRCIGDLDNVVRGIRDLNSKVKTQRRLIHAKNTICEPYFTAVIFPDVCFYTPNILNSTAPANMPMLVFHRGGPVYDKIIEHFKFLWWSGTPIVPDINQVSK